MFKILEINAKLAPPSTQAEEEPVSLTAFPCDFNLLNASYPMRYYLDNSGKSPNDYGLYDACQNLNNIPQLAEFAPAIYLKYNLNFAKVLPLQWGLCIPRDCYEVVNRNFTQQLATIGVEVTSVVYDDLAHVKVNSPEAIVMLCIASLLLLLGIVGMVFENTSLGNKYRRQPEH